MGRFGWIVAAAMAIVGVYIGTALGPAPVGFPEAADAASSQAMESEVARALAEPRAFPRASALIRLCESITVDNVDGAARAFQARSGVNDPVDLQIFLSAWAHLDPPSAMQEVQSWPIRSRRELGLRVVMREWAASGRQLEAGNYFDTLADPHQRSVAAAALVRGWALSGDEKGALVLARQLFEAGGRRDVIDGLVRGLLHSRGASGVFELARAVDPHSGGEFFQELSRIALDLAAREDPSAGADYFDELAAAGPTPWLAGSLIRLAGLLRNEKPDAALEWLLTTPDGSERALALTETMGAWAKRDFDAAWAWFEAHSEIDRGDPESGRSIDLTSTDSALLAGLVRRMARIRPAEAAPWAVRLPPEADRIEMLRRVAYFWSATDPEAADRWIAGLALSPAETARVREALDWGQREEEPGD